MEAPDFLVRSLYQQEQQYADDWAGESEQWIKFGVYDKAADMIDLKDEHWHADFGSGYATMLIALLHRAREDASLKLIGVERIATMQAEMAQVFADLGVLAAAHIDQSISVTEKKVLRRSFVPSPEIEGKNMFAEKTGVTLIQDDIRTAVVFLHLLGERKLDSASFLFPGTTPMAAFEAPYALSASTADEERHRRTVEVMRETRLAAFSLASQLVKPGGTFVVAERMRREPTYDNKQLMLAGGLNLQSVSGPWCKGWEDCRISITTRDVSSAQREIEWGRLESGDVKMHQSSPLPDGKKAEAAVMIARLTRNDVPAAKLRTA